MKTALITGITGQDGSYLAELLLAKGYRVFGIVRRSSKSSLSRIQHLMNNPKWEGLMSLVEGDLADTCSLKKIVDKVHPSEIYNLAAQSYVGASFEQVVATGEITGLGVTRILDAVRVICPDAKFYQASSSEMYGNVE